MTGRIQTQHNTFLRVLPLIAYLLNNCVYHELPGTYLCSDNTFLLEVATIKNVTSCLENDGMIEVRVESGSLPYRYSLDGITFQSHGVFQQLSTGLYILTVQDALGCRDTIHANVPNFNSDLTAKITISANMKCLTPNGSITIVGEAGTPPYLYRVDEAEFTSNSSFTGLKHGQYSVQIKDATLCIYELAVFVPRENTGISWRDDIQPVIQTRCAKSGCHDSQSARVNLTSFSTVFENRAQIKIRVANGSMPFDGELPKDQKEKILCWIDDGARNN